MPSSRGIVPSSSISSAFSPRTATVAAERERHFPDLRGRGWATPTEVARQAGVDEHLARARYEQALEQQLVHGVEVPEGPSGDGPTFAPRSEGGV